MDADVAFSDEHESRYPPIFRHLTVVFKHVRGHDFGHVDQVRAVLQKFIYKIQISQALLTASITVQGKMESETDLGFFQVPVLLAPGLAAPGMSGRTTACVAGRRTPELTCSGE
jgi:hypothetical protein